MNSWTMLGATTGPRSAAALVVWLAAAGTWLGWPIWWSANPPDDTQKDQLTPWVLAALLSLLLVLGWALWLDARRRLAPFAPALLLAMAAVYIRHFVNPAISGIELAFVAPLLAGMVLGAPAGAFTGILAAAVSAVTTGTVDSPLPGQLFVWALWGVLGGLLHRVPTIAAWLLGAVLSVPAGLVSGVLLNLTGWATEDGIRVGASVPGAGPMTQLRALWAWTMDTSLSIDLTRGISVAIVILAVGLPLLRVLRDAWSPVPDITGWVPSPRPITATALQRRHQSRRLDELWHPPDAQGEEQ